MIGTTELIASLDLGTTSARAIIFNAEGRPLAACQKPLTQYFPHDGWVEQDAEEIWLKQKECLLGALADLNLSGSALRALGITPTPLAAVAPGWLVKYQRAGRFAQPTAA